jgi:hypothetical protein
MNTLRQPRQRPRVESVNFRTLWWLLRRESYYVVATRGGELDPAGQLRPTVYAMHPSTMRTRFVRMLRYNAHWRSYP